MVALISAAIPCKDTACAWARTFDPASCHARKEQFGGVDGLAGAAVLHWPVHNEVMVAGAAQHAPESVRGTCPCPVLAHICIGH
jgi:hypothetical protein